MNRKLNAPARRKPYLYLLTFAIPVLVIMALAVCLEIGVRLFAEPEADRFRPKRVELSQLVEYFENDPVGFRLKRNAALSIDYGIGWGTVCYTTDDYRRRTTLNNAGKAGEEFIAVFGCSFEFGTGVNDEATLPSQIAAQQDRYAVYNYAVAGGSIQYMLLRLREGIAHEIPEKTGVGIFVWKPFMLNRAIGAMPEYNWWIKRAPAIELEAGQLRHLGTFESAHPWRGMLYDALFASQFLRKMNFNLPLRRTVEDMDLCVAMLKEAEQCFIRQFPGGKFLVVMEEPANRFSIEMPLRDAAIPCVNLYDIATIPDRGMRLPDDHPSPQFNRLAGKEIAAYITQSF